MSGGADSLCLAWLSRAWGTPLGLIVDHGLRPESAAEALATAGTLARIGIFARILTLKNLQRGPGLAARARAARYDALIAAAREAGLTHLLLGHHAGDQAETFLIREARQSGEAGLACMPSVRELPDVRLVRPLLGTAPEHLRDILRGEGIPWVEDPSNQDMRTTRARMRARLARANPHPGHRRVGCSAAHLDAHRIGGLRSSPPYGDVGGLPGAHREQVLHRAHAHGIARVQEEARIAAILGERAAIFPQGFAVLSPGPIEAACLAALIRAISGAAYPARTEALARLARGPLIGTLGGVRFLPAGRLGPGTLVVREAAALQAPIAAAPGVVWDRRFRLESVVGPTPHPTLSPEGGERACVPTLSPEGGERAFLSDEVYFTLGALGDDAARFSGVLGLPSVVLRTLPALRASGTLQAVPHLDYFKLWTNFAVRLTFTPSTPVAGAPFAVFCQGDAQTAGKHHVPG